MLYLEKEIKMKKIISTKEAPEAIGSYSQALLKNNTLYCSGQIAINPVTGDLIMDNITNETNQVMKNIKAANMDFSNVVKSSIFMRNMENYSEINKVYAGYFKENPPAREAVEVSALPKNVNVEISIIASH